MPKLNFSILLGLIFVSVLLVQIDTIYKNSLPLLRLPEIAHNTIGEIPMVKEVDKAFMEVSRNGNSFVCTTGSFVYFSDN